MSTLGASAGPASDERRPGTITAMQRDELPLPRGAVRPATGDETTQA